MEQIISALPPNCPMFFTVSLRRPGSDLLILQIERLRQAVRLTRAEMPFQINAWVVMPDHLHAIWTLPDARYDLRWRRIKARFSRGLPPTTQPVWQPRFWAQPLINAQDHDRHMRACQVDPLRHGLVDRAEDWPYSSFQTMPVA